jgi:hypothetical protein
MGMMSQHGPLGVAHVYANPKAGIFEMAVAGVRFGFCGVELWATAPILAVGKQVIIPAGTIIR